MDINGKTGRTQIRSAGLSAIHQSHRSEKGATAMEALRELGEEGFKLTLIQHFQF